MLKAFPLALKTKDHRIFKPSRSFMALEAGKPRKMRNIFKKNLKIIIFGDYVSITKTYSS